MSICFAPMVSLFLSLHLFLPKRPRNKKSPSPIVNTSIPHAQVHRCNRVCIRYEKSDLSVCRFLHPIKNHTVIPTGVITTTRKRRDRTGWGQPIRLPPFWEGNASFIRISVVHVYIFAGSRKYIPVSFYTSMKSHTNLFFFSVKSMQNMMEFFLCYYLFDIVISRRFSFIKKSTFFNLY